LQMHCSFSGHQSCWWKFCNRDTCRPPFLWGVSWATWWEEGCCDNIRTLYVLSIIQTEPQHTIITCDPHRTNQSYQSILLRGIHICSKTSILRN
jgi:hypothetical protein